MTKKISRYALREIVHELNQERELSFWDEPKLHYVAEVYEQAELTTWLGEKGRVFELIFEAHPFAYSELKYVSIARGTNDIRYQGFEPAPCVIEIRNNSEFTISNIQITAIKGG